MSEHTRCTKIARSVLVGLAAVAVSGMGFVGFAGAASAGPVSCASTVRLNSTYGYTYLTATGEVIGLSAKGCSTSSHTVKVTFIPLYGPSSTGPGDYLSVSKRPSCPVAAPKDCSFSFSTNWPANLNGVYLTSADAEKAYGTGAVKELLQFAAVQAATGYKYTLSFDLWTGSGQ
jgi:hypothetical protein